MRDIRNFTQTLLTKVKQYKLLFPLKLVETLLQEAFRKIGLNLDRRCHINIFTDYDFPFNKNSYELCVDAHDLMSGFYFIFGKKVRVVTCSVESEQDLIQNIVWNRDFFTGKEFLEKKLYFDGSEIKVPWELGRFGVFPKLAANLQVDEIKVARVFMCYVKSFAHHNSNTNNNIQWANAMEAGIRISNILITYNLLCKRAVKFETGFEQLLTDLALLHRKFILLNNEYSLFQTSNHFIANILGLTAIYAHFDLRGRRFILKALNMVLVSETKRNISENFWFEGSTAYHRFTCEMIIFTVNYFNITGIISESSKHRYSDMCINMANLVFELENPTGMHSLLGDSDGGEFNYFATRCIEINGQVIYTPYSVENFQKLVENFLDWENERFFANSKSLLKFSSKYLDNASIQVSNNPFANIKVFRNRHFIVIRSTQLYLVVNTMAAKGLFNYTHFHDDFGLVELFINNTVHLVDSGSFSYTSNVIQRNIDRSRTAHHYQLQAPVVDQEEHDVFTLKDRVEGKVLHSHVSGTQRFDIKIGNRFEIIEISDDGVVLRFDQGLRSCAKKELKVHYDYMNRFTIS